MEPPSPSQGLRFIIELPLRQASARTGPAVETPDTAVDLQGVQVLGVGGAETVDEWRSLFDATGASLQTVPDGEEAIRWFESRPSSQWPQLLVCELQDAGDGARELVRRLRRLETDRLLPLDRRIPAIAVVPNAEPDAALRALMAGFQAHVARPLKLSTLLRIALGILHRPGTNPSSRP
jgi:ATP-binding cassette subfamily B protein